MGEAVPFSPGDEAEESNARHRARRQRGPASVGELVLPYDAEAEAGVIAACCIDPDEFARAWEQGVRTSIFFTREAASAWHWIEGMVEARSAIDAAVLVAELQGPDPAAAQWVIAAAARCPTTAEAARNIRRILDLARRRQIIRTAEGAARAARECDDVAAMAMEQEALFVEATSGMRRNLPEVMKWGELIGLQERPAPAELVTGVLYRGGKLMLGGGSKSFKTWVLLDMALSVSTGKPWWGMRTVATPVLFVNFELQTWSFERRVRAICKAKGIESAPNFYVWNLRGRARDFAELRMPLLNKIKRFKIGLGILDPIYKCLGERDENSNGEVGELLNEIESVAVDGNCAMVHGHHFAKGDSSEKDKRDLTAGAGAWMRDPDSSIVLRPHEEEDCFTAEFILRDLEARAPMVVQWSKPCMVTRGNLDPGALRKAGRPKESDAGDVVRVLAEGGNGGLTWSQWEKACERGGMSRSTFKRRVKEAMAAEKVRQVGPMYLLPEVVS